MHTWDSNKRSYGRWSTSGVRGRCHGRASSNHDSRHRTRLSSNELGRCRHQALRRAHFCCCESRDSNTGGHTSRFKKSLVDGNSTFLLLLLRQLTPAVKGWFGQEEKVTKKQKTGRVRGDVCELQRQEERALQTLPRSVHKRVHYIRRNIPF